MTRIGVVFVCLGNICRSPVAEAVFRHLVSEEKWSERFDIDSAGTSNYHAGDAPDARSAETARRRGITLTGASRQLTTHDFSRFQYVIVMDSENEAKVRRLAGNTEVCVMRLREFDPHANGDLDVPDPWFGGPEGFDLVHDMVERACRGLLEHIARENGWDSSQPT